jgi:hypothetical protein
MEARRGRIPAPWRETKDRNVSLSDAKGTWFDHVEAQGGGVLDFICRVRSGDRQDALKWLADLAGVQIENKPLSPEDRERWARERRELEQNLPAARFWRRVAASMTEELLDTLKTALATTLAMQPEPGELMHLTKMLARLKSIDGAALVTEYLEWLQHDPQLTKGMVHAARRLESAERRAVLRYLELTAVEGKAA